MAIFGAEIEKQKHPSARWLSWKSSQKSFEVYNKEAQVAEPVKLEEEMIMIAEMNSVGGYVDSLGTGVRSNEIDSFSEPFAIMSNKGTVWKKGLWKDIKEEVKSAGAKLFKNIHFTTPTSLEMETLTFSGAGVSAWLEGMKNRTISPVTHRIKLKEVIEAKKGAVVYTYPVFENGSPLTEDDKKLQKMFGQKFAEYRESVQATTDDLTKPDDLNEPPF